MLTTTLLCTVQEICNAHTLTLQGEVTCSLALQSGSLILLTKMCPSSSICVLCIYQLIYKGVWNTMSGKRVQLPCKHRSFLKKPTLPPRPANSCVNLTREPQLGRMAVSLRSNDNMWRIDDLRLGPVCSRTWNAAERLRHDTSRQAPSHCKLCLICQHTNRTISEFEKVIMINSSICRASSYVNKHNDPQSNSNQLCHNHYL